MHFIDVYDFSITYFSLSSFIKYFKRELLPLSAIEEPNCTSQGMLLVH